MPGIGVILNPHSKRYRKYPERMRRLGFIVGEQADLARTENLQDLESVAREFKKKEIEILAITGGDGTNHKTLSTFIQIYQDQPLPKITFLRGGTLNTIASACCIYGTPEKILTNLLYKYHQGETFEEKKISIMKINDHYGFIWGCGVIFNFMDAYYQGGHPSAWQAAWTLARSIGSALVNGPFSLKMFEKFEAEVIVNGKKWPLSNYSALYAGSVEYLGLSFRVFYHARQNGCFHATGFSLMPRQVLPYVPHMFLGRPSGCPNLVEEPAREMIVRLASPRGYTIDGDMQSPTDFFRIEPGPTLTVIVR